MSEETNSVHFLTLEPNAATAAAVEEAPAEEVVE